MGQGRTESEGSSTDAGKQEGHAVLRKGLNTCQSIDKTYGLT